MNAFGNALEDFVYLGIDQTEHNSKEGWGVCPDYPSNPPTKLWNNSQGGLATVNEVKMCNYDELNQAGALISMTLPVYKPFPATGISRAINFNYSYPAGPVSQYAGTLSNNFVSPTEIFTTPLPKEK
jgi:hypothetical protein